MHARAGGLRVAGQKARLRRFSRLSWGHHACALAPWRRAFCSATRGRALSVNRPLHPPAIALW